MIISFSFLDFSVKIFLVDIMTKNPIILFDLEHTLIGLSDSYSTIHHYSLEAMFSYLAQTPESKSLPLTEIKKLFSSEIIGLNRFYFSTQKEKAYEDVLKDILVTYKLDIDNKDVKFLIEKSILAYFMEQLMNWQVTPGIKDVLIDLQQHGATLLLISNNPHAKFVQFLLKTNRLNHLFNKIILSADYNIRKPDQKLFDIALKDISVDKPENVFVIGDNSYEDIKPALHRDWQALLFTYYQTLEEHAYWESCPLPASEEQTQLPPTATITTSNELYKFLKNYIE